MWITTIAEYRVVVEAVAKVDTQLHSLFAL